MKNILEIFIIFIFLNLLFISSSSFLVNPNVCGAKFYDENEIYIKIFFNVDLRNFLLFKFYIPMVLETITIIFDNYDVLENCIEMWIFMFNSSDDMRPRSTFTTLIKFNTTGWNASKDLKIYTRHSMEWEIRFIIIIISAEKIFTLFLIHENYLNRKFLSCTQVNESFSSRVHPFAMLCYSE